MKSRKLELDTIRVNRPCASDWEGMVGDDRMRFCAECDKQVYNLSSMTRREIESLVRNTGGKFCARVIRDTDGSVITASPNTGLHPGNLRASKIATAIVTTVLTCQSVSAQSVSQNNLPKVIQADSSTQPNEKSKERESQTTTLRGTVQDITEAVIANARITLTNLATKQEFQTQTKDDGVFEISNLDEGLYKFKVVSPGFSAFQKNWMPIQPGGERNLRITLLVGMQGEVVLVGDRRSLYDRFTDKIVQPIKYIESLIKKVLP